ELRAQLGVGRGDRGRRGAYDERVEREGDHFECYRDPCGATGLDVDVLKRWAVAEPADGDAIRTRFKVRDPPGTIGVRGRAPPPDAHVRGCQRPACNVDHTAFDCTPSLRNPRRGDHDGNHGGENQRQLTHQTNVRGVDERSRSLVGDRPDGELY